MYLVVFNNRKNHKVLWKTYKNLTVARKMRDRLKKLLKYKKGANPRIMLQIQYLITKTTEIL